MTEQEIREAKIRKMQEMGLPMPIPQGALIEAAAATQSNSVKNKGMLSKLDMIKRGANRGDFQKFIQKAEPGVIKNPNEFTNIPVGKSTSQPVNQNAKVALESFAPQGAENNSEAMMMEKMLLGGNVNTPVSNPYQAAPVANSQYHLNQIELPTIDYKAKLEEKYGVSIPQRQPTQETHQENLMSNSFLMKKLNELENRMQDMAMDVAEKIAEKIVSEQASEIAREVAKDTVSKIIVEFAKSGKQILIETNKVKKAEIVAKDKVKIDGKVYKLTEVKV